MAPDALKCGRFKRHTSGHTWGYSAKFFGGIVDAMSLDTSAIETHSAETRSFRAEPGVRGSARACNRAPSTTSSTERASSRPTRSGSARRQSWCFASRGPAARVGAAAREVVRRRDAQRHRELPRPAPDDGRRATRPRSSGRASRARRARSRTSSSTARSVAVRGGAARARRREGRPRRDLHGHGARGRRRDARVRAHRRDAHGRLRRLRGRGAPRSHQRLRRQGPAHAGRRAGAAATSCRSRRWSTRRSSRHAERREGASSSGASATTRPRSTMKEGRDSGGTTRSTPPSRRARRSADDRRRRAPALHPLHVGLDRQAEGRPAHDRRLPRRRARHDASTSSICATTTSTGAPPTSAGSPGHSYIVYGPLSNGATCLMYEGAPNFPDWGRFWQHHREARRHDPLHGADGDPRVHPRGRRVAGEVAICRACACSARVGEPINPEAWIWYHEHIGGERCPIVDTWWQTETGSIMLTTLPGAPLLEAGRRPACRSSASSPRS